MRTKRSWALTIRVPSFRVLSPTALLVLAALVAMPLWCAQSGSTQALERLAASYRQSPNVKDRAALLHFAAAHTRVVDGALARLAIARGELSQGRVQQSLGHLDSAAPRLAELSDYVMYLRGLALAGDQQHAKASEAFAQVIGAAPPSPLRTDAAIQTAKSFLELAKPDEAIRTLRDPGLKERQPEFGFLLGKAYLARDDLAMAATHLQQVYTEFPARKEAQDAEILLGQLRQRMGDGYPPLTGRDLLLRGEALRSAGQHATARAALEAAVPQLMGEEKERAQVLMAAADYDRMQTSAARSQLDALRPQSPEADAHRLYLLVQCARRLKQVDDMLRHAKQLRQRYPRSEWTMEAHRWAGNFFLLDDDSARFVPLFEACADAQPKHPEGAYCHWKVAWQAYRERKPDAHLLMAAHLERYPFSEKYAAALLFLGRLAERDRRLAAARTYYEELATVEPMSYYAELAKDSLGGRLLQGITADAELARILASFRGRPLRESFRDLKPAPETQRHLARAALLARVHFMDWVELEVRSYGADANQRQLLAVGLANTYAGRGDHFRALRTMKSMAPGYFRLQPAQAPQNFWELLFPMPYAQSLASYSRQRGLDPYLVAGLIRQESEYKADAVSRAKAYGLMQVLPSTGRSLARTLRLGTFNIRMLTRPETNVNLGTFYLAQLAESFDGRLEYVLASYNAGKSRADRWKTWGEFAEPIEFIETIPFTETREYVLSVYRNAMVYRAVYPDLAKAPVRIQPAAATAPTDEPAAKSTAVRKPAPKAKPRRSTARKP